MITDNSNDTMQDPKMEQDPIDPGLTKTGQQITSYLDDRPTEHGELPGRVIPDSVVLASGNEPRTHTIEDILSRPALVATASWGSSSLQNTDLVTLTFPDALFQRPIVQSKLANFTLFRADICVRVVLNTTPFQAGKLLCYFSPLGGVVGERGTLNNHIQAKTCFPHAILDAGVGNIVELRIPYVNPYNHYRLTNDLNEMGTVYLTVLNPLRSASAVVLFAKVFAWFENIDLGVPTAAPFSVPSMVAQSGRMRAQVNTEMEDKTKSGLLSDVTSKFSTFSRSAEGLPLVGKAFEPLTWMSNAMAQTLDSFGFCKPTSVQTVSKYVNIPSNAYTNGEGVDEGTTLSVMPTNSLQPRTDVFGSTVDEMDIKYIASRLSLQNSFQWQTSGLPEAQLYQWYVSPMIFPSKQTTTPSVQTYYEPTMVGFLSSGFEWWRGSMKYKVQVAKTGYHSGRLRIMYVPAGTVSSPTPISYDADLCYNWILDLRTSSEIEFEIPFTSVVPWLQADIPSGSATSLLRTTCGIVAIEILNPLVAPTTVADTVDVNVWVAGGSDFELARPSINKWVPVSLATPTTMVAQVGAQQQSSGFNDFVPAAKMFNMTTSDTVALDALSIGESVRNLRCLIKRFGLKYFGNIATANSRLVIPCTFGKAPNVFEQDESQAVTPCEYFSYLYRFYRGSFNYKGFFRVRTYTYTAGGLELAVQEQAQIRTTNTTTSLPVFDVAFQNTISEFDPTFGGGFTHTTFTVVNPTHEVNVPYYGTTSMLPIWGSGTSTTGGVVDDVPATNYNNLLLDYESSLTVVPSGTQTRARVEVWKAGGDDMQFGWLVGPPRIARFTGVTEDSWSVT